MTVRLGWSYMDKVTGFKGMATGHVTYLTGCSQVLLNPTVGEDGKLRDANWFDEQRLMVDDSVPPLAPLDNTTTPGPDKQAPKY